MAATLTGNGELTIEYASFPIEKTETTEDGDLIVYGKASDGGIDSDQQIVDPSWMASAAQTWKTTGANLRVQHNPQRDPAGVGLEVNTDGSGSTWVKGLVVEPIAKKLVAKGALTAYSVGIARPTIVRDAQAPGGRITGGELVEISLVDRPANKRCGIQLMKSVDGAPEYTGEMFGEDEDIQKALGTGIVAKSDTTFSLPQDMTFTFTPNDLAKILKNKFIEQHYDELAKEAANAAEKESRVADATDTVTEAEVADVPAAKEAEPVVTKDPADGDSPKPKKGKKGKKLPPFLQDDGDADDDAAKAEDADAEKCSPSGTPKSTSGAADAADMKEIPDTGPAPESPAKDHMKTQSPEMAAMLRFKTLGIDTDLGRLHDLTCPAYHPDEVSKYHPFADFKSTIDVDMFQRKALDAAAGKSLQEAMDMQMVWQSAYTLKSTNQAILNDIRLDLHKAFRDANPGPTSYPSPGCISPQKYNRPLIGAGHAATSDGHDGPNSSPSVASGPVGGAGSFAHPPLASGHQSPSPSHMKNDFEVPAGAGVPQRLTYAHTEKEQALIALGRLHTHLGAVVPHVCPMDMNSRGPLDPNPATTAVGVGKNDEAEVEKGLVEGVAKAPVAGSEDEDFIEKAFKKSRKKLGKKVLSGKMTVDEARSRLGRMSTQKNVVEELRKGMRAAAIEMVDAGELSIDDARKALGLKPWNVPEAEVAKAATVEVPAVVSKGTEADLIKSAVAEAISPLQEMLTAQRDAFESKLAEQQKVIDAIADAPDPRGEPFSGLAQNMNKSARPVAVPDVAEAAERTQQMMLRQLEHTWRTSENPMEREVAWNAIKKFRGLSD